MDEDFVRIGWHLNEERKNKVNELIQVIETAMNHKSTTIPVHHILKIQEAIDEVKKSYG